jgi:hypothetical protein
MEFKIRQTEKRVGGLVVELEIGRAMRWRKRLITMKRRKRGSD